MIRTLIALAAAFCANTGFTQDAPKTQTQVAVSTGFLKLGKFEQSTNRMDITRVDGQGKGFRGDLTVNLLADHSVKQTFRNHFTFGHITYTGYSAPHGKAIVQAGLQASREIVLASRTNTAGPFAGVYLPLKMPVALSARLDVGSAGLVGGRHPGYVGLGYEAAVSPVKSVTAFSSGRIGLTDEGYRAQMNGLVWNLESLNRKIPATVTLAHISDRQRIDRAFLFDEDQWMLNASVRLKRFKLAK